MDFLDLIRSDGYITVSKALAKEIGLKEAIILSELISQYKYFKELGELDEDGFFYCTVEKMKENTTIEKRTQSRVMNNLVDLDLIIKERKGLPAKRYFKLKENNIKRLLMGKKGNPDDPRDDQKGQSVPSRKDTPKNSDNPRHGQKGQNGTTRGDKTAQQDESKCPNIYNNNYNNKTEEEDANPRGKNFPDKIKNRFEQIFNRELSVEFYNKLTKKYSDEKILIKALEVAEENADKPSYLLRLLSDWQNNGLTSISSINTYLEERKAKKQVNKANKETAATTNNKQSLDELYESGYR